MKTSLFPFQELALKDLRIHTAEALGAYNRTHTPQVISFTAPTGAGKTIIMTAFVENVLFGDEHFPEQPNAIFVWLSDSPELNQQSKLKFETKSDRIRIGQCVTISDDSFDKEFLEDGTIYFLNTQKLGNASNLTKHSDTRQYTIWETLRNTIYKKTSQVYFIIDEAHRGMKGRKAAEATTIMQKFLKGSEEDNLKPMPLVIGMSATSERFNKLVEGTASTIHKVVVTPNQVRSSGLLKDRIVISYSEESSVNKSMAVLQAAADEWKSKCDHWQQYCSEQHYASINPIFLIQVENRITNELSATDLDDCLKKIELRTGLKFTKGEVVHTFGQTDSTLHIAGLEVPYEEPSQIQDNKQIRVVFFKENLSTGWDCPRAETMMSFRRAKDATYIAQLLGRMIRTPMQMHIQVDDSLNDVHLFLPFFEKETVDNVIEALQSAEGGDIPTDVYGESIENKKLETLTVHPVKTNPKVKKELPGQQQLDFTDSSKSQSSILPLRNSPLQTTPAKDNSDPSANTLPNSYKEKNNSSTYSNATTKTTPSPVSPIVFEPSGNNEINASQIDRETIVKTINDSGLLTYDVRKVRINNYVKSMFSLARLLSQTNMDTTVLPKVRHGAVNLIASYVETLKAQNQYERLVRKAKEFKLSTQTFDVFGQMLETDTIQDSLFTTDVDIDRQFRIAECRLESEGIANEYLRKFYDPNTLTNLKIDVILFTNNDECIAQLNSYAQATFHKLNDEYRRYMTKLSDTYRKQYDRIVSDGDIISKHNFRLPETITVAHDKEGISYYNHLFVNDDGYAKIKLNSWEQGVLEEEVLRDDFICWLRNPPRAPWSLCIPYEMNGEIKPMYPDFIVIRKDPVLLDQFIIDVLEPHNPAFTDNLGKAKGFAEYARKNPGVGRIELIRQAKDAAGNVRFKRLDMSMSAVRDKVLQAMSDEELIHIFDTDGKFE